MVFLGYPDLIPGTILSSVQNPFAEWSFQITLEVSPTYRYLCGFTSDVAKGLSLPEAFQASVSVWEACEIRTFIVELKPGWFGRPPTTGKMPVSPLI